MFELKSIQTRDDFKRLCDRLDFLENHPDLANSDELYKELNKLYKVHDSCRDKIIGWQFVPEVFDFLDEKLIENAYQIFEKKSEVSKFLRKYSEYENDINELTFSDTPEEKPNYLDILKVISKISKKKISLRKMLSEIDEVAKPHEENLAILKGNYTDLSFAEFVIAIILEDDKAPLSYVLVKEGFIEKEDYLKIDPKEFKKRKGVGVKLVDKLTDFQEKIRNPKSRDWDF